MINRSEVVGRPLAALLANDGACVYSVDVTGVQQFSRGQGIRNRKHEVVDKEGWTLEQCLPISDVVISGVPGDKYKVPVHLLRDGVVCVNFSSEKVCDDLAWGLLLSCLELRMLTSFRISHQKSKKKQQSMFQQSAKSRLPYCCEICSVLLKTKYKQLCQQRLLMGPRALRV